MLFVITKYPLYLVELRPSDAMARNLASQCPSLKVLMSTKAPNWTRMSYPESRNPTKTEPQQTLSFRELFLIFSLSRFHIIYIGLSRRGLTRLLSARPPVHDHDEETLDTIDHECDLDAYCKGCKTLLPGGLPDPRTRWRALSAVPAVIAELLQEIQGDSQLASA